MPCTSAAPGSSPSVGSSLCPRSGVVVMMGGRTVYHCGDTGLTMEMQLLAGRVDAMLVPIGDNYTMGVEDAVRAVEFVQPRAVIPMHYNTWDVIKADPEQRSEEHTSELQSLTNLVCRLLLEKKKI